MAIKEKMVYTPSEEEVGKEAPNPHQCKVSSVYVPVFSSIVPGEDEDAFCSTQNTHLKWLSISVKEFSYTWGGGGGWVRFAERELEL